MTKALNPVGWLTNPFFLLADQDWNRDWTDEDWAVVALLCAIPLAFLTGLGLRWTRV